MGMPLPMGKVRSDHRDSRGLESFVGRDMVDLTPKNEKVRLDLGNAFDVAAGWSIEVGRDREVARAHSVRIERGSGG